MAYEINWVNGGVITRWLGCCNSKEIIQFLHELHGDPRFDEVRFSVHDYLKCDEIVFSQNDMDIVGSLDKVGAISNPKLRIAIIAEKPELVEMVGNYKRLELSPYEIKLFSNAGDAEMWFNGFSLSPSLA